MEMDGNARDEFAVNGRGSNGMRKMLHPDPRNINNILIVENSLTGKTPFTMENYRLPLGFFQFILTN